MLVLEVDQLDLFTGAECVVDDPSRPHVLELGADERPALARLDVLEIDDGVGMAVEDDAQPFLEFSGGDLHDCLASASEAGAQHLLETGPRLRVIGVFSQ